MTCGAELTDFEGGADDVLKGLDEMVGDSSSPDVSGWKVIDSGFKVIESGLVSCAKKSWWGHMKSDVKDVFEDVVPEVKFVEDAIEIIVNGEDIYDELKSAYDSCRSSAWESCGTAIGGLVSTLKNDHVLVQDGPPAAPAAASSTLAIVGGVCGGVAVLAAVAVGAQRFTSSRHDANNQAALEGGLALDGDYSQL